MTLEPFHQGWAVKVLMGLRVRYRYVPLIIFGVYWLAPLLVLMASLTTRSASAAEATLRLYIEDWTHLFYSLLISVGGVPAYAIVRLTGPVVRHTLRITRGRTDYRHWKAKYRTYQSAAFSTTLMLACGVLTALVLAVLISRVFDARYSGWWGHISHGYGGIYFCLAVSQMVFWGAWSFFVVGAVSLVLSHIAECKFYYDPLRADGCNGLRPVGLLIMLMWAYSLIAAMGIYVLFSRGYLGIERYPVIWVIAVTVSICLPLVAISPLISVTSAIRRSKELYLLELQQLAARATPPKCWRDVEHLSQLLDVRSVVSRGNIFPFRNQTVLFFSVINAIQLLLSTKQFLLK
jgi:hypothetical protein